MRNRYDAIIIGAGIGGLVAGCYLSKLGSRVLIIEQQNKPGGCCTSFEKNGYKFDVAVHYLGGINKGILGTIFDELGLRGDLKFNQFDPVDKIITPKIITYIRNKSTSTIKELKHNFSKERNNIDKFFSFVLHENIYNMYKKVGALTTKQLLDTFFEDRCLKSTLNVTLRNIGLCANESSSLAFITLLKDYILDPGYYPIGGMQELPNKLADKCINFGGKIILNHSVNKIVLSNKMVQGVRLDDGQEFKTNTVISNINATDTFFNLLKIKTREQNIIKKLVPSPSLFLVYVGLNNKFKISSKASYNIWPFLSNNLNRSPVVSKKEIERGKASITTITFPSQHDNSVSKKTATIFSTVEISNKIFWDKYKNIYANSLINKTEKIIPFFSNFVDLKIVATPYTFQKYTSNKNGSAYGWASNVKQISTALISQKTSIPGLFLAGHWSMVGTGQGGVSKSAFSGRRVASLILNENKSLINEFK
ncbi:MAG: NAD(P)/FAD-dependent oxidoreductase [Candidatus Omnitrophota bacterium]|nr:NAD(P)/FAD-dependent oxidoreductase [Candidatus Omnitrophota bacterium]